MKYRKFGKLDWEVSVLGFGAMRLPILENDQSKIVEPEAIEMIRTAIDSGVNYVDTAYGYHGGNSEVLVGKALGDGYRNKVRLATKLFPHAVQTAADFDRLLDEQLKKLSTDHIDFYLLHGINKTSWPKLRDLGVLEWSEKAKADGRIRDLGFSFHDTLDVFKEIIDAYDQWTFCQIQYNFMDTEYQAGTEGLQYAAGKGLGIVIMEPLRGGALAKKPPENVAKAYAGSKTQRSQADWALQWVWNHPEVSVVLSGMSTMTQVTENLASADRSGPASLSMEDLAIIDRVREEYITSCPIPCTGCRYCMPCPNDVDIPGILSIYNNGYMYDEHRMARFYYRQLPRESQADKCVQCDECGEKCPQDFDIPEALAKVHGWLGPKPKA
ncbi:MAG: aldo/keto reductase [Proteobacteria bacterium]|nr:aldo/keto reductase [Pseudomonadota bacterium]MBU4472473.1 aldo/keto reductase [Pseudomonadota bacterium]MCG2751300.1 aldo/keto reductase [Desulfobacteraceae bacterium]